MSTERPSGSTEHRRILAEFKISSEPGNERWAMNEVAGIAAGSGLPERTMERLKTAVAEATMNAMEHGNGYDPLKPAKIQVSVTCSDLIVTITDEGRGPLDTDREEPDLAAKLQNQQTPRGWGLFLIKSMVDEMNVTGDENHHTVELIFHLDTEQEERGGE